MIITFEGLSCAGKTALSNALYREYPNQYEVIPEFIYPTPKKVTTDFCRVNDVGKMKLAHELSSDSKIVIMDRGWLSTVVYEYADTGGGAEKLIDWYVPKSSSKNMFMTDCYVYLRLSAEDAIERAKSVGRFNTRYAWYFAPSRATAKYDELFQDPELKALSITVDAMRPFDQLVELIHTYATKETLR